MYKCFSSSCYNVQVIAYSTQSREHSYSLIIEAIKCAVQASLTKDKSAPTEPEPPLQPTTDRVHETDDDDHSANASDAKKADPKTELREALLAKFGSARGAYESFSKNNAIGKREWRRIIRKTLPSISVSSSKALRKQLPNMSLSEFSEFMGEAKTKNKHESASKSEEASDLADLPVEVPLLPAAFRARPDAHERLILALLDSNSSHSTALTAPKSRVSSQGSKCIATSTLLLIIDLEIQWVE